MPRAILLDQISRQRRVPELYGIVLALPLNIPEENMGLMALISVPRAAGERLANSGGWAVMRADIILLFLRIERYANVHDAHLSLYALNRIFSQLPSPSLPLLSDVCAVCRVHELRQWYIVGRNACQCSDGLSLIVGTSA